MKDPILEELMSVLGKEYVSNDPAIRVPYSRDQTSSAWDKFRYPDYVVLPESTEEIQRIVSIANKYKVSIIPWTTGANVAGKTIPIAGGIQMEFKRMNKLEIDEDTMSATVEPYVPILRLQAEAKKKGLRTDLPGAPSSVGVISNFCTTKGFHFHSNKYGWGADKIIGLEMVLPTGEILRTGHFARDLNGAEIVAANSLGMDLNGLPYNSFGTFGIVTKMSIKLYPRADPAASRKTEKALKPHLDKFLLFATFAKFENAVKAYAECAKSELGIGQGCAGPAYWTSCLPVGTRQEMLSILEKVYTMGILEWVEIEGTPRQVEYQKKKVKEIFKKYKADFTAGTLLSALLNASDEELPKIIENIKKIFNVEAKFPLYWVNRSRDLFDFSETPTRAFAIVGGLHMREVTNTAKNYLEQYKIWKGICEKYGYLGVDTGIWSMFVSTNGPYNWVSELDVLWDPQNKKSKTIKSNISKALLPEYLKLGSYHHDSHSKEWDKLGPQYGIQYEIVKRMKRLFDPNNIMHRGILYP